MLQIPPRLDGLKVYDEVGDEQVLLELALAWGSSIKVRHACHMRFNCISQSNCSEQSLQQPVCDTVHLDGGHSFSC